MDEAFAPMSVSITLEDDIDISRGDMLARVNNQPVANQELDIMMCWLHASPAKPRGKYIVKHTTNEQKALITEILYRVDINTLERETGNIEIGMNDICRVRIKTMKPLMTDTYKVNRATGSLILIDEATNETVAAGMII
jgi:sulfate adenylyltransferase subunit 1